MKSISALIAIVLLLGGCYSVSPQNSLGEPPKISWIIKEKVDEFSDVETCMVTMGSLYTQQTVYEYSALFYPFVASVGGELMVGVRSGGKIKMPVGNVQLRIDDNEAWLITTAETPIDDATAQSFSRYGTTPGMADSIKIMAAAISPYTAVTGDKARQILNQMIKGDTLIYRSVGTNIEGTTGRAKLDDSFEAGLVHCGIVTLEDLLPTPRTAPPAVD